MGSLFCGSRESWQEWGVLKKTLREAMRKAVRRGPVSLSKGEMWAPYNQIRAETSPPCPRFKGRESFWPLSTGGRGSVSHIITDTRPVENNHSGASESQHN